MYLSVSPTSVELTAECHRRRSWQVAFVAFVAFVANRACCALACLAFLRLGRESGCAIWRGRPFPTLRRYNSNLVKSRSRNCQLREKNGQQALPARPGRSRGGGRRRRLQPDRPPAQEGELSQKYCNRRRSNGLYLVHSLECCKRRSAAHFPSVHTVVCLLLLSPFASREHRLAT